MIAVDTVLYFYSYATDYRLPSDFKEYDRGDRVDHLDLLGQMLGQATYRLVRSRRKDRYVTRYGIGSPLRGRPDFRNPRLFDTRPYAVPFSYRELALPETELRFISLALVNLVASDSVSETTKRKLRAVSVLLPEPSKEVFLLNSRPRPSDHWGKQLSWCLILAAIVNRELDLQTSSGRIPFIDFVLGRIEEGELFKRYVAGFLSKNLGKRFSVTLEKQLHWKVTGDPSVVTLVPRQQVDVVASDSSESWVIEVKSGPSIIRNQWGQRKLNSQHLRQLFSYLYLFKKLCGNQTKLKGALIFHDPIETPNLLRLENFEILLCPINLSGRWRDIEARMNWLILRIKGAEALA